MTKANHNLTISRLWRPLALAVAAFGLLFVLAGCAPGVAPLTTEQERGLAREVRAIQAMNDQQAEAYLRTLKTRLGDLLQAERKDNTTIARTQYLIGYTWERRAYVDEALDAYSKAQGPYRPLAAFREGEITLLFSKNEKKAGGFYNNASSVAPTVTAPFPAVGEGRDLTLVLASNPDAHIVQVNLLDWARLRVDQAYHNQALYRAFDTLVKALGANPKWSYALALILLAVIVKLVTTPLTVAAFRGMRNMQRVQPLIKEIQEKHKGDQATIAREQMRIFRKYRVSPLGGCLPMLIQMPILILVYQAIRVYIYQFSNASFLWIPSLAQPNWPLLILYAGSMYLSQKLTAMPPADPQQQQMQNSMAIMMPIMFTFLFQTLPSAFILYWFTYNILITAHQMLLMRRPLEPLEAEGEAAAAAAAAAPAPARPQRIRRRR